MLIKSDKIFLIGFMGCGKSTLGKKLAKKLEVSFVDLDQKIEEVEGRSISEIFADVGEDGFREIETQQLKELINTNEKCIIALGGGAPCFNQNIDLINGAGISVYLKYNVGILTSRLITAKQQRPLIAGKTNEELSVFIEQMLKQRETYYLQSDLIVEGKNITASQVTDLLFENS